MHVDAHVESPECIGIGKILGFDDVIVFSSERHGETEDGIQGIIIEASSGRELIDKIRKISGKKKLSESGVTWRSAELQLNSKKWM